MGVQMGFACRPVRDMNYSQPILEEQLIECAEACAGPSCTARRARVLYGRAGNRSLVRRAVKNWRVTRQAVSFGLCISRSTFLRLLESVVP